MEKNISRISTFFEITNKIVEKDIVGHAYIIQVDNNYERCQILDFIKKIVNTFKIQDELKHQLCDQIDKNEFQDLKILNSEGQWIKKEQINELQKEMKTKSLYDEKRFYIIEFAENLNKSSANSILKFLEEPDNNIVALLITKNINMVIDTIVSRCQILSLKNVTNTNVFDEKDILEALKYLNIICDYNKYSIAYLNDLYQLDCSKLIKILEIVIEICYDCINFKIKSKVNIFLNNENDIIEFQQKVNLNKLISFVNIIETKIQLLKFNLNTRLFLDKLIIEMVGE